MNASLRLLLLIGLCFCPGSLSAQETEHPFDEQARKRIADNFGEAEPYWEFLIEFRQAVTAHNAEAVATMVHYPIYIDGHPNGAILSEAEFVQEYDRIFTPNLTRLVVETPFNALMINWRGIAYGKGEIWIIGYFENCNCLPCASRDLRIHIVTINPGLYGHLAFQPGQAVFEQPSCDDLARSGGED